MEGLRLCDMSAGPSRFSFTPLSHQLPIPFPTALSPVLTEVLLSVPSKPAAPFSPGQVRADGAGLSEPWALRTESRRPRCLSPSVVLSGVPASAPARNTQPWFLRVIWASGSSQTPLPGPAT